MKKETYRLLMDLSHNPFYAFLLKKMAESGASRYLITSFADTFNINKAELAEELKQYGSLQEFFMRELKPGSRPVSQLEKSVVSPVDGVLTACGELTADDHFSVKGKEHSLASLLRIEKKVEKYAGGTYGVFYLSPKEYHRIHSPAEGIVTARWALGDYSEPVNDLAFQFGIQPLASNYRLITEMDTPGGRLAVVKVGALNVNSVHYTHTRRELTKGEEFASFGFGSSVILLAEPGVMKWSREEGDFLKQGEAAGFFKNIYK
jgi:phosphatidylserine decarboxylase